MKKLICIIIAAAAALCFTSCSKAEPVEVYPPFWVVRDHSTGGTVYMLGSFHVGVKGTVYPDYVIDAFDSSDRVAVELDTLAFSDDRAAISEAVEYLRCPDGTTAADYFADSYSQVKDFYKQMGWYSAAMDDMKPYYWASVMSNNAARQCGFYTEYGSESIFLTRAKSMGKPITELESGVQQYKTMGEIPMDIQVLSVTDCIGESYAEQEDTLRQMMTVWASFSCKSADGIEKFVDMEQIDSDGYGEYYDMMYTSRQKKMAEQIVQWLSQGEKVFMLVGAMHYYAEPDILTLLEDAGYTPAIICGCGDCIAEAA